MLQYYYYNSVNLCHRSDFITYITCKTDLDWLTPFKIDLAQYWWEWTKHHFHWYKRWQKCTFGAII